MSSGHFIGRLERSKSPPRNHVRARNPLQQARQSSSLFAFISALPFPKNFFDNFWERLLGFYMAKTVKSFRFFILLKLYIKSDIM